MDPAPSQTDFAVSTPYTLPYRGEIEPLCCVLSVAFTLDAPCLRALLCKQFDVVVMVLLFLKELAAQENPEDHQLSASETRHLLVCTC